MIISDAPGNIVGGTDADDGSVDGAVGARNVISGDVLAGVQIEGPEASGNRVEGNFIGTNALGTEALNDGQGIDGVKIDGAPGNVIGGTEPGARNVISGSGEADVRIFGGATRNRVAGNFIGTGADGTGDLGVNGGGVIIANASDNTIGGLDADDGAADGEIKAANVISGHRFAGVLIFGAGTTGNRVLSNPIFSNGGLGIDLNVPADPADDVTANDTDDPDTGPNNLQNFPRIGSATRAASNLTVSGTLNSTPSQSFTIQCFLAASDPSGHGEGRSLLAQTTATTNAGGDASFTCAGTVGFLAPGQTVTATATNTATGDTSEFSQNVPVR